MNNINKKNLQTIQNVLAVAFGISLRILKKNAWEIFYDNLSDNHIFKKEFPDKISFATFLKNCKCDYIVPEKFVRFTKKYFNNKQIINIKEFWETYPDLNPKYIWETYPSNLNPFYRKITQSPHIKICTLLCLFKHCILLEENNKDFIIISKCFTGTLKYITELSNNSLLIGGYQFEKKTVKNLNADDALYLDGLVALQQKFLSMQSYFTKKDLILLSHHRMPITKQRIEEKVQTIKNIFDKILHFIKQHNESENFSRNDWIKLVEFLIFFSENLMVNRIDSLYSGITTGKELIPIRFLLSDYNNYLFTYEFNLITKSLPEFSFIKFDKEEYEKFSKNALYKGEHFLLITTDDIYRQYLNLFKILDHKFSDFLESNYAKRRAKDAEYLLELHDSLYTNLRNSSLSDLLRMIINKAVNFVSADTGIYLRYSPHDRKLLLDTYPDDEIWGDEENVNKYKERIANWAKSPTAIEDSIISRAINEREPIIINDLLAEEWNCLQLYGNKTLSRLTIPIVFQARVLGVINADGFSRNQFSLDDLYLLNEFTKDIAPFVFQNNYLKKVENITKIALQTEMNDASKLNYICENIAGILFSAGTALWLQDDVDPKLYKLVAGYKYKFLKPGNKNEFKYYHGSGLSGKCVQDKQIRYLNNVEENKDELLFSDNLLKQGFNSVMVIPILLPDEEVPIGSLSVYDYTMEYESLKTSSYLLQMIGRFLALAITAVKELHRGEKQYIELTAHELGQSVTSLSNTTKRLMHDFDRLIPAPKRDNDLARNRYNKLFLLIDDLNEYIKDAECTLSALVSDDIERVLKRRSVSDLLAIKYMSGEKKEIDICQEIKTIVFGKLKGKKITFDIMGPHFSFNWYKPAVIRVLNNVIENAINYMDKGTPCLHIEMQGNPYLNEVVVSNIGLEIKSDEYEDIFRNKYRSNKATQVNPTGKGIGLFFSRCLAREWQGRVYVKECKKILEPEFKDLYKTSFAIVFPKT